MIEPNFELLEEVSELLKTLGHPVRLSIVNLLHANKSMSVTDIFTALEIEQAVASHHLRLMKKAGIVDLNKKGKSSYYFLSHKNIYKATKLIYDI